MSCESFISRLLKNDLYGSYSTTLSEQTASHKVSIKGLTNKLVAIYDENLLKRLCNARKIIFHKIASFSTPRRETHVIVILFEKYEKFLPGVWLVTNKVDPLSYESFLKYIRVSFPCFKPMEAVVDYDKDMQCGLRSTFPKIKFIPSLLHQMQEMVQKAIQTSAAVKANRILNSEKHSVLKKFIALSLLPKDDIRSCHINLVKDCRANYGLYFDLFVNYYNEEWIDKWKPEIFCVHQMKDLVKTFSELYGCRKTFATSTEIEPVIFLDKIKTTLSEVRINLVSLEHGNVLPYYLSHEDEDVENKLYKTWDRLSKNSITVEECLTICSNLLDNSFIDGLTDSPVDRNINNNNSCSIHDMTTEKLK